MKTLQKKSNPFNNKAFQKRLTELKKLSNDGEITDLALFQEVKLSQAAVPWKCPFVYKTARGATVYEAFKTERCPVFKVIVRLWGSYGPGRLISTAYKGGKIRVNKTVEPFTKVNIGGKSGLSCGCLDKDAWTCAVKNQLTTLLCDCSCHRTCPRKGGGV